MDRATFWAIFFTSTSGRPVREAEIYFDRCRNPCFVENFYIISVIGIERYQDYLLLTFSQNYFFWGGGGGQRPLVPLLLLGPPFFLIILFGFTTLLTGMAGISMPMQ
jgi:hypothetical protein